MRYLSILWCRIQFNGASSFNSPLTNWNMGSVTDTSSMFANSKFNHPLVHNFVTNSNVDTSYMFYNNKDFNQDISGHW